MTTSPDERPPSEGGSGTGRSYRKCYLCLLLAVVLYGGPLLLNWDNFGRRDWDQFSFRYETARVALLRDHQLPLWNPYANGGTVLLAHPHCPAMSPWFGLVLALGAPIGLRLQVLMFMALGTTGMAALLKRFGVSPTGGFVGGIIFMMSSHFALHIAEGHMEWGVLGLMPWLMILLLKLHKGIRYVVAAALLLASVMTFGSVYIPAVFLPFFSLWAAMETIRRKNLRVAFGWGGVVVLMLLLSAIKLAPQLHFSSAIPPRENEAEGFSPRGWATTFFNPQQVMLYRATRVTRIPIPERLTSFTRVSAEEARAVTDWLGKKGFSLKVDWHEYGCYPTMAGMLLALIGICVGMKRHWPMFVAAAVMLNTMFGYGALIDTWALMQKLPLYGSLSAPSRFLAVVIFVLAFASGFGLDWLIGLVKRLKKEMLIPALRFGLPAIIYIELLVMGWGLFGDVFVCDRATLEREGLRFEQHDDFAIRAGLARTIFPIMSSTMMPYLKGNSGMLDEYENAAVPRGNVKAVFSPGYRGEAYLQGSGQPVLVKDWTMSSVEVGIEVEQPDLLVLNQNFSKGWRATIRSERGTRPADAGMTREGLVAVNVAPGDREVILAYRPTSVPWGIGITALSLAGCVGFLVVDRRRRLMA